MTKKTGRLSCQFLFFLIRKKRIQNKLFKRLFCHVLERPARPPVPDRMFVAGFIDVKRDVITAYPEVNLVFLIIHTEQCNKLPELVHIVNELPALHDRAVDRILSLAETVIPCFIQLLHAPFRSLPIAKGFPLHSF